MWPIFQKSWDRLVVFHQFSITMSSWEVLIEKNILNVFNFWKFLVDLTVWIVLLKHFHVRITFGLPISNVLKRFRYWKKYAANVESTVELFRLINWWIVEWIFDWLIDWLINWLIFDFWFYWIKSRLIDWFFIRSSIDWSIDWLIDRLVLILVKFSFKDFDLALILHCLLKYSAFP